MWRTIGYTGLTAAALLIIAQCSNLESGDNGSPQLARVGTEQLTLEDARQAIPPFQLKEDSIASIRQYRDQWIRKQLLLREADNLELAQQHHIIRRIERNRQEILQNALKELIITQHSESITITDQEIEQYFEKNRSRLALPEPYVRFRHVETTDLSLARSAREALRKDSLWVDVAQNYSLNPDAKINKSKTYWPLSTVLHDLPTIKPFATSLDSGAISPIRRVEGSYHFIQVIGKRDAGAYPEPEWITDELHKWLMIEKQRKYYDTYVKNLYLDARENNDLDVSDVSLADSVNIE